MLPREGAALRPNAFLLRAPWSRDEEQGESLGAGAFFIRTELVTGRNQHK